jgi:ADP-L-glycero-D-manno-heptose 6-epimerase
MIVVTGGAGFIGSALVKKLNDEGLNDILIVDSLGSSEKWKNLTNKKFSEYLHKEIFLQMVIDEAFGSDIDAIFHLGACTSTTETNAEYMIDNNFNYTRTLAEYALEKDIRFIYASSAAVYGSGKQGFSDDNSVNENLQPLNIYAYSKLLFDQLAIREGADSKLTGFRFFNVFGPNEYHKADMRSVVLKSFEQIRSSGSVNLFKSYDSNFADGEQKRDFVYVKDCVEVLWWALQNKKLSGIYNLGTGQARSWNELTSAVFSALGQESKINYIEMPEELRGKYQYLTQADLSKLRDAGCKLSFTSLEEAIKDYVCGYLANERQIL